MPERISTKEAAKDLGVNDSRVRQLIKEHGIEPEYIGKAIFLTQAQVDLLKTRHAKPGPRPKLK